MKSKVICMAFILLLAVFTCFDLATPTREFSEWENKNLEQRPKLTASTLLSGEYGSKYEKFMTDQFVMRDELMKVKFVSEMALGKRDSGGVYVTEDALYGVQQEPDYEKIDKSLEAMESFARRIDVTPYLTIVPSSTYVYSDKLPAFAPVVDEKEVFDYVKKNANGVEFFDITDDIMALRDEYIYFRTDHHWTLDGAMIGYNAFMQKLGKPVCTRDDFDVTVLTESFYGTHSSKSGAVGITPDTMERADRGEVTSVTVYDGMKCTEYSSIYFDEFLKKKDKYSYYLGTNQPIVRVKTDSDGGRLLVFKDSYSHIMTPLMIGDWSEIVLVDLRYVKGKKVDALIEDVLGEKLGDFDTVLFMYSADTFTTQYEMAWIK